MSDAAVGIHAHPTYKTGRRAPKNAPALEIDRALTGKLAHPISADYFAGRQFGLYGNDRFGVCGPTYVANSLRLVSAAISGVEIRPSEEDVFALYRLSGNPNFDPSNPNTEDNGVDMQTMLEALLEHGIGDGAGGVVKPLAFAKATGRDDDTLAALVAIFGGVGWGVNLLEPQQGQTDAHPPRWTHVAGGEWGGHAVLNGKFEAEPGGEDCEVISWAKDVQTDDSFRKAQLEEVWLVIWPQTVEHPGFHEAIDTATLKADYKALTGKELVLPEPPTPAPSPAPGTGPTIDDADRKLWAALEAWDIHRHVGQNHEAALAARAWAREKGLLA